MWHSAEGIAQSVKAGIETEAETLKHGAESIVHSKKANNKKFVYLIFVLA